jgi:hypothetical protein
MQRIHDLEHRLSKEKTYHEELQNVIENMRNVCLSPFTQGSHGCFARLFLATHP